MIRTFCDACGEQIPDGNLRQVMELEVRRSDVVGKKDMKFEFCGLCVHKSKEAEDTTEIAAVVGAWVEVLAGEK